MMNSNEQNWEVVRRLIHLHEENGRLISFMQENGMLTKGGTIEEKLYNIQVTYLSLLELFRLIAGEHKT